MTAARQSTFADRLRHLRTAAGLSQGELARRAHLSRQALSLLEAGDREPALATAKALASALGVTLDSLAG